MKIFDLKHGDKFILNGNTFIIRGFFKKYVPTRGSVLHMKATDQDGREQWFIRNLEVEVEDE